ncbi:MAG: N-acetylmuramoyl-L-alanine amidase [Alphaproteobacteria bacterium]|nr:N-acetylmuramoyl-L-alanine amidase [Alphaproteobacteria bacterium]
MRIARAKSGMSGKGRLWRLLSLFVLAGILMGLDLGASARAQEPLIISAARLGEHPDHTRFVMEISGVPEYRVFSLADPYRIVLELPEAEWRLPADTGLTGQGLVKGYRYGRFAAGRTRIVMDLWKPAAVLKHYVIPGKNAESARLVIELGPVSADVFLAGAGWPKDAIATLIEGADAKPAKPRREKPVIVIDPGHGGKDPGTKGATGTYEKDVVLAAALSLRDALLATGRYEVVLTRETDVFIKLRERVDMARRAHGDLFISLHADAIENKPKIRGVSVYTLSEKASDREAAALAEAENAADIIDGADLSAESSEVRTILIDLAQRETINASTAIANRAVTQFAREIAVLDRPVRAAGFIVLKAPDIPSVLVEMGFLSNTKDEKELTSASYRKRFSTALVRAIDDYFAGRESLDTARVTPAAPAEAPPSPPAEVIPVPIRRMAESVGNQ